MSAFCALEAKISNSQLLPLVSEEESFQAMLDRKMLHFLYFSAVLDGDLSSVEPVIAQHPSLVNATAIEIAGEIEIRNDIRPLFIAANRGNIELVNYLISNKVDIDARDESGDSALVYLFANQSAPVADKRFIFELLYASGADIDVSLSENRGSILMHIINAGIYDDKELTALIDKINVSIDAQDKEGYTALDYALGKGLYGSAYALLQKAKQPLSYIFTCKSVSPHSIRPAFEALLAQGADMDQLCPDGKSLFSYMICSGKWSDKQLAIFVDKINVSINAQDEIGFTALDYAMAAGYDECALALVKKTRSNIVDKIGRNVFSHIAIVSKSRKSNPSQSLIIACKEAGWDMNAADEQGRTPIFYALIARDSRLIDEYQLMGANLNMQDIYGKTPFHCYLESLAAAMKQGDSITEKDAILTESLCYFSNIDLQDQDGNTPLHLLLILSKENAELFKLYRFFVSAQARIDLPNKQGKTAFDLRNELP